MEQIIPIESIQAVNRGLEQDLQKIQSAHENLLSAVHKYAGKEAAENYTPKYRNQELSAIASKAESEIEEIFETANQRAEQVINQEPLWSIDGYLRKARITPEPKMVSADSCFLPSEKQLVEIMNRQAATIGDLAENAARDRWISELERMPRESFLATVQEAEATEDAALIYLAQLALSRRIFSDDSEREFLRQAVQRARYSIKFPQREEAVNAIDKTKQLRIALREAKSQIAGCKNLNQWIDKQLKFISSRETVKRYERANVN